MNLIRRTSKTHIVDNSLRHSNNLPHPIPYQGSKRLLADRILGVVAGRRFKVLYEPFVGSGAITIASAARHIADEYRISDTLEPLIAVWRAILNEPEVLADAYERVWTEQLDGDGIAHFNRVRDDFNAGAPEPALLVYLLARCVKNSPRFNKDGAFNQSPDKRRRGMRPSKMRNQIADVSALLRGRARAVAQPFEQALTEATPADLIYLDPPWQGTSSGRDRRYHEGLGRERLELALADLHRSGVPVLLSYDGRCGDKTYGPPLPDGLGLVRLELHAGRSSQATLLGRADETVESLYVSASLLADPRPSADAVPEQLALIEAAS